MSLIRPVLIQLMFGYGVRLNRDFCDFRIAMMLAD